MDFFDSVVVFFQNGGVFMYPIVLILAFGAAIALERYIYLASVNSSNRRAWQEIMAALADGDFSKAREVAGQSQAAIATILGYGLSRTQSATRRDEIETAMEEGLMEVLPRLEKRTHYLATFANLATLLGLLGTIIGLIQGFTAVANANPTEKADMLSASISVAMNTTAFGLMVAIPLLLVHALLQTKTTELVDNLEMSAVKFLNILTDQAGARRQQSGDQV